MAGTENCKTNFGDYPKVDDDICDNSECSGTTAPTSSHTPAPTASSHTPEPSPGPSPGDPNLCSSDGGSCTQTLCDKIFPNSSQKPNNFDNNLNIITNLVKEYCKNTNDKETSIFKGVSDCDSIDLNKDLYIKDHISMCFPPLSDNYSNSTSQFINMKLCTCFKDNKVPAIYNLENTKLQFQFQAAETAGEGGPAIDANNFTYAFPKDSIKPEEILSCDYGALNDGDAATCKKCGYQIFDDDIQALTEKIEKNKDGNVITILSKGDTNNCCPGFIQKCVDPASNELSYVGDDSNCSNESYTKICVFNGQDSEYKDKLYTINTAGSLQPTSAPTASPGSYQIINETLGASCSTDATNKTNSPNPVKINIGGSSIDVPFFKELEGEKTNCCVKKISKSKKPGLGNYIIGRKIDGEDCTSKICNTNLIDPSLGSRQYVNKTNFAHLDIDSNQKAFKWADGGIDIIFTYSQDDCCKHFTRFEFLNEAKHNEFLKTINPASKTLADEDVLNNYISILKNQEKRQQFFKPNTSQNKGRGMAGLCLYTGDKDNTNGISLGTLKTYNQETWTKAGNEPTPAPADCEKTCIINLEKQVGQLWFQRHETDCANRKGGKCNNMLYYLKSILANIDKLIKIKNKNLLCGSGTCKDKFCNFTVDGKKNIQNIDTSLSGTSLQSRTAPTPPPAPMPTPAPNSYIPISKKHFNTKNVNIFSIFKNLTQPELPETQPKSTETQPKSTETQPKSTETQPKSTEALKSKLSDFGTRGPLNFDDFFFFKRYDDKPEEKDKKDKIAIILDDISGGES